MWEDEKEYIWQVHDLCVLKFHSDWCAVLLYPSHNTAKDLDKTGGLSTVFFFSNCSFVHWVVKMNYNWHAYIIYSFYSFVFCFLFLCRYFYCCFLLHYLYMHYSTNTVWCSISWSRILVTVHYKYTAWRDKMHTTQNTTHCGTMEQRLVGRKDHVDRNLKREGGKLVFVSLCFNYSTIC